MSQRFYEKPEARNQKPEGGALGGGGLNGFKFRVISRFSRLAVPEVFPLEVRKNFDREMTRMDAKFEGREAEGRALVRGWLVGC